MLALTRTLLLGTAAALCACSAGPSPSGSGPAPRAKAAAEADAKPGYTVDVELPPKTTKGQESIARVRVQPTSPWHMNLQYPAKLRLQAPDDVALDTELLSKADAERFDDNALVFSVLFTPEAKGTRTIDAQIDFAVCGDASCGPITESVELAFEVGCRDEDTGLC